MWDVDDFCLRESSKSHPRPEKLARVATKQHGVVCRRQLLILGFSPAEVNHLIGRSLLPLHRGVFAVGHSKLTARGRCMAAILACGPRAVLSHASALALWALRPWRSGPVEVSVIGRGRGSRQGIRIHCLRALDQRDTTLLDGIPLTTIPRTLLDAAETCTASTLDYALEDAQRRPDFNYHDITALIARSPGRHGLAILAAAIKHLEPEPDLTFSEQERIFRSILREEGIPEPRTNVLVEAELVDFAWPEQRVIVEWDSWQFHRTRRKFEEDRRRDAKLQAAGYRILRVTFRRLRDDRAQLIRELRALLGL